jgi:protein arginine kinase activator
MMCHKCHKNAATIRYAEVMDGRVMEQQLCEACAEQLRGDAVAGFEIAGPTAAGRRVMAERTARDAAIGKRICPDCGMALTAVIEEGRAGCARCYQRFAPEVDSLLEGLHPVAVRNLENSAVSGIRANMRHTGKKNLVDDNRARLQAEIQTKRGLLRTVLRAEDYEEAARLRDEIGALESGLPGLRKEEWS